MRKTGCVFLAIAIICSMTPVAFATEFVNHNLDRFNNSLKEPVRVDKMLLAVNEYDESGLIEAVRFEYDENGLLSRSIHENYNNGELTEYGHDYIYTYDDAGRLLSRCYYYHLWSTYEGYDGLIDVIRTYNDDGLLATDNWYGEGEVSGEYEYTYNESGQIIRERSVRSNPILGGKIENEYSYSYNNADGEGIITAVRHNETDSSEEDVEFVFNTKGQLLKGCERDTSGGSNQFEYEYADDPYFCIRDEYNSYTTYSGESQIWSSRSAIILDIAGQEVESFTLGEPEAVQMTYDEDGYLIGADGITNTYYTRCEFIYGEVGASALDAAQEEEYSPLHYEEKSEHYETVTSSGILSGTADLEYPYFTDGSPIAEALNDRIEGVLTDMRGNGELDEQYEDFIEELAAEGNFIPGWDNITISVKYNENGLISLLYETEFYGSGAAHPYTEYEGHTFDVGTCEELDYRDLVGSGEKLAKVKYYFTQASVPSVSSIDSKLVETYVLTAEGLSFYCNVGSAVPREIITIPFTSEYFDRAPAGSGIEESADTAKGASDETTNVENETSNQKSNPILTVTADGVNVRTGPGTEYESLGKVNKGDKLFSTDKSNNWYKVGYGSTEAYIIEDFVTIEHGGFYTEMESGTLSVNGIDVNIRRGPGTEYQSIGQVSRGTTLTIIGKSDNWYLVEYNGGTGYIIEDYVIRN